MNGGVPTFDPPFFTHEPPIFMAMTEASQRAPSS